MPDSTSNRNQNYVNNDGRSSTFGRSLAAFIQNRLPYANIIDTENNNLNPKYKVFADAGLRRSEALAKNSIALSNDYNNIPVGSIGKDSSFGQVMYANIQENKGARLRDYRIMAAYSDVADALDELCDETINTDEHGSELNVKYRNVDLSSGDKGTLDEEFLKFSDYFDFKNKGWQYFRQLLIEGELFFELIILLVLFLFVLLFLLKVLRLLLVLLLRLPPLFIFISPNNSVNILISSCVFTTVCNCCSNCGFCCNCCSNCGFCCNCCFIASFLAALSAAVVL